MVERTSDHFDSANSYRSTWQDVNDIARNKMAEQRIAVEKYERAIRMGGEVGGGGDRETLDMNEDETGNEVKTSKKQELK